MDDKVESLIEEPREKTDPVEILDLSQQTDRDANDAALGKFFFNLKYLNVAIFFFLNFILCDRNLFFLENLIKSIIFFKDMYFCK